MKEAAPKKLSVRWKFIAILLLIACLFLAAFWGVTTTCYEHVEFRYDKESKVWISYDYGTDRLHKCEERKP